MLGKRPLNWHPASRILTYLVAALVIPGLPFFVLMLLLAMAVLMGWGCKVFPWRLLWRSRWFIAVLLSGYAFTLPGEAAWPVLGDYSPSIEGMLLGLDRAARFVLLLLGVEWLILRLRIERILMGLHALLRPFAWLGLDVSRFSLRLALTLQVAEQAMQSDETSVPLRARPRFERFLQLLKGEVDALHLPVQVVIGQQAWAWFDFVPIALMLAVLAWVKPWVGAGL